MRSAEPTPRPMTCPECRVLTEQVRILTEQSKRLTEKVDTLSKELEEAKRSGKRQAAPFGRGKRKKNPKKPGRGKGHKGARRENLKHVDRTVQAPVLDACPDCSGPLEAKKNETNYQTDTSPIEPIVTRFDFESAWCPCCAKRVYSRHEEQISVATGAAAHHLGPRVLALAADLKARLGIPYRKITDILRKRFGITVSAGALAQANG